MPAVSAAAIKHRREHGRERYANDPAFSERKRKYLREYDQTLRRAAFDAYGGVVCVRCGNTEFDQLQLDHVNGDGAEHRRLIVGAPRQGGIAFYRKLRALGWPHDPPLQVLCHVCNRNKEDIEGKSGRRAEGGQP